MLLLNEDQWFLGIRGKKKHGIKQLSTGDLDFATINSNIRWSLVKKMNTLGGLQIFHDKQWET